MAAGFDAIRNRFPTADTRAESRERAALAAQAQAGVSSSPAAKGTNVARQATAVNAQLAGAQGQLGAQQAQQRAATQQATGQLALQAQQQQAQQQLAQAGMAQTESLAGRQASQQLSTQQQNLAARKQITQAQIDQAQRLNSMGIDQDNRLNFLSNNQRQQLASLGQDLQGKLFDAQTRFARNEQGRKFNNERQMMDYTVASAKSNEEMMNKLQSMQQMSERKIKLLEISQAKLQEALNRGYLSEKQKLDNASKQRIAQYIADMKKKMEKEKRKAAARGQMISGIATMAVGGALMYASAGTASPIAAGIIAGGAAQTASGASNGGAQ